MDQVDQLEWADKPYTIEHLISDVQLPCLVKVCAGIYNDNEDESFSTDDVVKLDSSWITKKVKGYLAEYVNSGERVTSPGHLLLNNQLGSNSVQKLKQIPPPLKISTHGEELKLAINNYSAIFQIRSINGEKCVYCSVTDLIAFFPRYVKTATSLCISSRPTLTLDKNVMLELIKTDAKYLIVKVKSGLVVNLPINLQGEFHHVKDETWYTLNDVVSRFPLPQFVKLKSSSELKRILKANGIDTPQKVRDLNHLLLTGTIQDGYVIGHHKVYSRHGQAESGYIFTLPLNSEVVQDLEFLVADNVDTDDYQTALFEYLTKEINIDEIQKNIYDYAYGATQIVKFTDANCPNLYMNQEWTVKKETTSDSSDDDDGYEDMQGLEKNVGPETSVADCYENISPFDGRTGNNRPDVCKVPPVVPPKSGVYEYVEQKSTRDSRVPPVMVPMSPTDASSAISKTTNNVPPVVPPKPSVYEDVEPKSTRDSRAPPVPIRRSHLEAPSATYNTTTNKLPPSMVIPPIRRKNVNESPKENVPASPEESPKRPSMAFPTFPRQRVNQPDYTNSPLESAASPTNIPTLVVSPFFANRNDVISSLSVNELSYRLHLCGLHELSERCQGDRIDGELFCCLSVDDLVQGFSLSTICLKKVEKFKEGWIPKM